MTDRIDIHIEEGDHHPSHGLPHELVERLNRLDRMVHDLTAASRKQDRLLEQILARQPYYFHPVTDVSVKVA